MLPKIDSSLLANKEDVGHLFTGLLEKVRERLHDSHKRVRLAAAMCLYTLSEYTSEVMDIIKHNLEQGAMLLCFYVYINIIILLVVHYIIFTVV